MNVSKIIERFDPNRFDSYDSYMKDLGYKDFSRKITIFVKENKNLYNIRGNNVVTNVGCLVTNICKYTKKESDIVKTYFNKTVYLCDLDCPSTIDNSTTNSVMNCLDKCTAIPLYAFSNNIIETSNNSFTDLGLTLIDLSMKDCSSFGIINCSGNNNNSLYKEVIYGSKYNPMYYSNIDIENNHETRIHTIEELVDNKTRILFNKREHETVINLVNNEVQKGIFIDKYIMGLNEYMSEFFTSYLFLPFDNIEFVYDSRLDKPLNVITLNTFYKFGNDTNDYLIEELMNKINQKLNFLKTKLETDFYLITRISDQFILCDLHIFSISREIRLSKPLYRQYCEYAIDSEMIINDIEYNGEIAKLEYIDKSVEQLGFTRNITSAINMINDATHQLSMIIEENKSNIHNLISNNSKKYIEDKHEE